MKPVKLKVTIKLLTPLHVGGEPGANANTAYILRGADGHAYYPGTAFKGKLRHYALSIMKEPCDSEMYGDCPQCKPEWINGCPVYRLFGGGGNSRGSLFFGNLTAEENPLLDLRAGNSIDRYRRVAEDQKLFTTESAAVGELTGYITGNAEDDDITLLRESIQLIGQIGGNTSRGFGWIDGEIAIAEETGSPPPNAEGDTDVDCVLVTVTPKSPMMIGTHTTQSNYRDTRSVIPGAVLRAALARAICEQDGTDDPTKDGIKNVPEDSAFPRLREAFEGLRFDALRPDTYPAAMPMTMRICKSNEQHGEADILAAILRGTVGTCPICGDRLERIKAPKLNTVTSTHSEMDKLRGTSRDGRLYTVKAIAPDAAMFSGTISGKIPLHELRALLTSKLRVGAMLTAGFGECDVVTEPIPCTDDSGLQQRIVKFNEMTHGDKVFVPITLMSDAVVSIKDLKEPADGDYVSAYKKLLEPILGDGSELTRVITKPRIWRGFDTGEKYRFEKEPKYILEAGSVFVVAYDSMDAVPFDKLHELEQIGIGDEKRDGYGAVSIVHSYHINNALPTEEENGDD